MSYFRADFGRHARSRGVTRLGTPRIVLPAGLGVALSAALSASATQSIFVLKTAQDGVGMTEAQPAYATRSIFVLDTAQDNAALSASATTAVIADFDFADAAGTPLVELPDGSGTPGATLPGTAVADGSGNGHVFTVSNDDPASSAYERTADRLLANRADGAGGLVIGYPGGADGDRSSTALIQFNTPLTPGAYDRVGMTLRVSAWSFEAESSDDDEFFRIGFGDTSATNITAQMRFIVPDSPLDTIQLQADALGAGGESSPATASDLSLVEDQPVTFDIVVDYTTSSYQVLYQRDSDLLPTEFFSGSLGADAGEVRASNFLRFTLDDNFSDDTLVIERLSVWADPVPEPAGLMLLSVAALALGRPGRSLRPAATAVR